MWPQGFWPNSMWTKTYWEKTGQGGGFIPPVTTGSGHSCYLPILGCGMAAGLTVAFGLLM